MATFRIESTVRGHHVYKSQWTPGIGEEICVHVEEDNTFDEFTVPVSKDEIVVGHNNWQKPADFSCTSDNLLCSVTVQVMVLCRYLRKKAWLSTACTS